MRKSLMSARQQSTVSYSQPLSSRVKSGGRRLTSKRNVDLWQERTKDEWNQDEEDLLAQGLNPRFIQKDISHLSKSARDKINMTRKIVKDQGSVKQLNPVIGLSCQLHYDDDKWYEMERERHFPVEFYSYSNFLGKVNSEPEPCSWILDMKTHAEEVKEKNEIFMIKLRGCADKQVARDLKFL